MSSTSLVLAFQAIMVIGRGESPSRASTPPDAPAQEQTTSIRKVQFSARLHRLRADRIQQSLGLSQGKAETLADRWGRYDAERWECREELKALRRRISNIFLRPISETQKNAEMRRLMIEFEAIRQREHDVERDFTREVQCLLEPIQQAQFFLLEEELRQALKESLRHQVSDPK